jgi:hypothetical protein
MKPVPTRKESTAKAQRLSMSVQRYNLGPMNYVPVVRSVEGSRELILHFL